MVRFRQRAQKGRISDVDTGELIGPQQITRRFRERAIAASIHRDRSSAAQVMARIWPRARRSAGMRMRSGGERDRMTDDLELRIRERAYRIRLDDGQPEGKADDHWELARIAIALEDAKPQMLRPITSEIIDLMKALDIA